MKRGTSGALAAPHHYLGSSPLLRPRAQGGFARPPGHGPVAAGAPHNWGASPAVCEGSRAAAAPGSQRAPRRSGHDPGRRGRLGVGTGRGRGSSSPFRRPSSRLPRPLFPGRPLRPPARWAFHLLAKPGSGGRGGAWGAAHFCQPGLAWQAPGPDALPGARPSGHTPACPDLGRVLPGTLQRPGTGSAGWGLASPRDAGDGGGSEACAPRSVSTERSRAGWRGAEGTWAAETRPHTALEPEGLRKPALHVHFRSSFPDLEHRC